MGRNVSDVVHWTHMMSSSQPSKYTWYCQHHQEWDQTSTVTTSKNHIKFDHGATDI